MRKIITVLVIAFCANANGQVYHKFLKKTDWYESQNPGFGQPINYYFYHQSTDTVMGGIVYAKILVGYSNTSYFVREDTLAQKVYIKRSVAALETLLYDFDMLVGDTFDFGNAKLVVRNIDSVNTLQGYRKRLLLTDTIQHIYIQPIESIGDTQDPFFNGTWGGDPVYMLVCNYQNNVQLYDCNCAAGGDYQCYSYGHQPCNATFTTTYGPNGQATFTNLYPGVYTDWNSNWPYAGFNDTVRGLASYTHTFPCNSSYSVSCTVSMNDSNNNTCSFYNYNVNITNSSNGPNAGYTYTLGVGGQISFTNTSNFNCSGCTYNYYWTTYNIISGSYLTSGLAPDSLNPGDTYIVNLNMGVDNLGCSNIYSDTIHVLSNTTVIQKSNHQNVAFSIYPNPTSKSLNLVISEGEGTIIITDVLGKTVIQQAYLSSSGRSGGTSVDVGGLSPGVYFVRMGSSIQKFIKE